MVVAETSQGSWSAPTSPSTSCPPPHTTTTLAPLPHDRLDPPACQPVSVLHHWHMDCVSKGGCGGQQELDDAHKVSCPVIARVVPRVTLGVSKA